MVVGGESVWSKSPKEEVGEGKRGARLDVNGPGEKEREVGHKEGCFEVE